MRFAVIIFAGLACASAAAKVRTDTVHDKITGAELVAAMEAAGLPAMLAKDKDGDLLVRSKYSGWGFVALLSECDATKSECARISFVMGIDLPQGTTLEKVNAWNNTYVAQAYLDDDKDPFIEWTLNLEGGITDEALASGIDLWKGAIEEATDFFSDAGA